MANPEPSPYPDQACRSPPRMAAPSTSCNPASDCSSSSRSSRWRSPTSEPRSFLVSFYVPPPRRGLSWLGMRAPAAAASQWTRGGCRLGRMSYRCCCREASPPHPLARVWCAWGPLCVLVGVSRVCVAVHVCYCVCAPARQREREPCWVVGVDCRVCQAPGARARLGGMGVISSRILFRSFCSD